MTNSSATARTGPAAHLELVLAVTADVLGIPDAPPDVSIFVLGGSSMDAARLCAEVGRRTGVSVPLSEFFHEPTARHVASMLDSAPVTAEERQTTRSSRVPLLPIQVGFLFDRALGVDSGGCYTMSWWVDGDIAEPALRAALIDVQQRHEALRSKYVVDSEPVALVQEDARTELLRLRDVDDEEQAQARVNDELTRPFDVESGEVLRAAIVAVRGRPRTLFACAVHHLAFDGYSEPLFVHDLSTAYEARRFGRRPVFATSAPSLAEISTRFARQQGADLERQRAFWVDNLRDIPRVGLPWPYRHDRAVAVGLDLAVPTVARLDELAVACGTTRFAGLLAAFAESLRRVTGRDDFGIGVPIAHRADARLAEAIGCLVNVLCLRVAPGRATTFRDAVENAGRAVADAMAARDVPIAEVSRFATGAQDMTSLPYEVEFTYLDGARPNLRLGSAHTVPRRRDPPAGAQGIIAEAVEQPDGSVGVQFYCAADERAVQHVETIAAEFAAILARPATAG